MWFYKIERDEKNKYINITWNTTMTYIKSILGVVGVGACLFNLVWLAAICLTILAVALTYYLYRYGNLVRILHSHEQKKGLEYTGSQYSFKDPPLPWLLQQSDKQSTSGPSPEAWSSCPLPEEPKCDPLH